MLGRHNKRELLVIVGIVLLLAALALVSACAQTAPAPAPAPTPAPAPAPAPVKTITLKAVSFNSPKTSRTVIYQNWLKDISAKSKGELVFEFLGGPEVIPATEQPAAVRNGVVHISMVGASHDASLVPEINLMVLSRITPQEEETGGANAYLRELHAKVGLYYIGRFDPASKGVFWMFLKDKKVARPQELAGLRMGANGTYAEAFGKALGMSFSVVNMADAFSALDRGMYDAYSTAIDTAQGMSIQEVVKYVIDHPFYTAAGPIIMNLSAWNNLPANLQKLIIDTYREWEPQHKALGDKAVADARKAFQDKGAEFYQFSAEDAKTFIDLAISSERDARLKQLPTTGPKLLQLIKAM